MPTNVEVLWATLKAALSAQVPPLCIAKDEPDAFEVSGTKPVMQGKQQVEGHYFASLVPKPKDVRFYFFPIYTHAEEFDALSPDLQKALKGKSCFHIKRLSPEVEAEIEALVHQGLTLYQRDGLV
jgi:hypothetical protein